MHFLGTIHHCISFRAVFFYTVNLAQKKIADKKEYLLLILGRITCILILFPYGFATSEFPMTNLAASCILKKEADLREKEVLICTKEMIQY